MTRIYCLTAAALIFAGILAACGGQPAVPVTLDVGMSEYAYTPAILEARVGQEVTINLTNAGTLEHELMIGREVAYQDGQPNGFQQDLFAVSGVQPEVSGGMTDGNSAGGHMHANPGVMVTLPSGEAGSVKFTATKDMVGEWEMGCFSQEGVHYTAGMVGKLVVIP